MIRITQLLYLAALLLFVAQSAMGAPAAASTAQGVYLPAPVVMPTPVSTEWTDNWISIPNRATVVLEKDADVRVWTGLQQALTKLGVKEVVRVEPGAADVTSGSGELRLLVFIRGELLAGDVQAKDAIEVPWDALGREGYLLSVGAGSSGASSIILAANTYQGAYYGAQTLAQLSRSDGNERWVPVGHILDRPAFPYRGTIEGFYGPPWSHQARLRQMDFYGEYKMNTYVYAPKDDPYHRQQWRTPYPEAKLAELAELVQRAHQNYVDFVFAISPGVSVRYSSGEDFQALVEKTEAVWKLGVRSFALLLDDIDPKLKDSQDKAKFGTDYAAAQAFLINRYNEYLKSKSRSAALGDQASRLIIVPTDYWQDGATPYRTKMAKLVDPDVIFYWTGIGVVAPTITAGDTRRIANIFQHDLLVWDNYPVNDYARDNLFIGPFRGRDPELAQERLVGFTANPMNEAEASKVPLITVADYVWNPQAYRPGDSWEVALDRIGGTASPALRLLAVNTQSSPLWSEEAPILKEKIFAFLQDFGYGTLTPNSDSSVALAAEFLAWRGVGPMLHRHLDNPLLLEELAPYVDKMTALGTAGYFATRLLTLHSAAGGRLGQTESEAAEAIWASRLAMQDATLKGRISRKHFAAGAVEGLLARAVLVNNAWFGIRRPTVFSSFDGQYAQFVIENMVDENPETFYWTNRGAKAGDYIGIDLGRPVTAGKVELVMSGQKGEWARPKDYIEKGVLQYSLDGEKWMDLGPVNTAQGILTFSPVKMQYVRILAQKNQQSWVQVTEFKVHTDVPKASATLGQDGAGSANSAVDTNIDTVLRLAEGSVGELLKIDLERLAPARAVHLLQSPDHYGKGLRAEVSSDGNAWKSVGASTGSVASFRLDGSPVRFVRLVADTPLVSPIWVHEVVVEFEETE